MRAVIAGIFLLLFLPGYSQCDVSEETYESGLTSIKANFETVYRNRDLENGLKQLSIQTVVNINGDNQEYFLMIAAAQSYGQNLLVPRALRLALNGSNTDITLTAETMKTTPIQGGEMKVLWYKLDQGTMNDISQKTIRLVTVLDTRTSEFMYLNGAGDLIKSQLTCVQKALGSRKSSVQSTDDAPKDTKLVYEAPALVVKILDKNNKQLTSINMGRGVLITYDSFFKSYRIIYLVEEDTVQSMNLRFLKVIDEKSNTILAMDSHDNTMYVVDQLVTKGQLIITPAKAREDGSVGVFHVQDAVKTTL